MLVVSLCIFVFVFSQISCQVVRLFYFWLQFFSSRIYAKTSAPQTEKSQNLKYFFGIRSITQYINVHMHLWVTTGFNQQTWAAHQTYILPPE